MKESSDTNTNPENCLDSTKSPNKNCIVPMNPLFKRSYENSETKNKVTEGSQKDYKFSNKENNSLNDMQKIDQENYYTYDFGYKDDEEI